MLTVRLSDEKKNVFLVPYGKIRQDFIDQVTSHINDWNNSSDNCHVSQSHFCPPCCGPTKTRAKVESEGKISKLLR